MRSFTCAPAVVASGCSCRLIVHLLPGALADIRNQHRASAAAQRIVKRELPGITKTKRPDLRQRRNRHTIDERIVSRHDVTVRIIVGHVDVDPQQLAEQRIGILRIVERIVPGSTVSKRNVEDAVRTKREVSTVVVREWLRNERLSAAPTQIETR